MLKKNAPVVIILILVLLFIFLRQSQIGVYLYVDEENHIVEVKDVNSYLPPYSVTGNPATYKFYANVTDSESQESVLRQLLELSEGVYFLDFDPTGKDVLITVCVDPECEEIIGSTRV